jgi:hypothetical protein|tara:strand:- start:1649 stop:1885 length:237 start_codon:yes stop_codon:yes gene_type:complete
VDDPLEDLSLADRIQELMTSPVIEEVFNSVEREIFEEWITSADSNKRESLYHEFAGMQRFLKRVRAHLDNATLIRSRK